MIHELFWADNVKSLCHRDIGVFTYIKIGLQLHAWDHGLPEWILTCKTVLRYIIRVSRRIRTFATSSYEFLFQSPDHRLTKDGHIQNKLVISVNLRHIELGACAALAN